MNEPTSPILELQKQQLLLKMEYEEERKAFQEKVDAIGMERRVQRGDAWFPIRFSRSYYNSLNQFCVEVLRVSANADEEPVEHNFEFGRPVSFFKTENGEGLTENGELRTERYDYTLRLTENGELRTESLTENGELRTERYDYTLRLTENGELKTERYDYTQRKKASAKSNHTSQFSVLSSQLDSKFSTLSSQFTGTVSYVDGDRMVIAVPDGFPVADLQQEGVGVQLSFDETSYRMMFDALERTMRAKGRLAYLRDLMYTRSMKAETYSFADLHFPYLNQTQEHAVNEVLRAKDVAIVHGPPGTGKTTTLVEAIHETLRREPQVLVCTQSNMAVDWISERLVDRGINVLRIGNPVRVDDKMLSFTYERRFEAHPDYPQLWAIRKAIRQLRQNRKRGDQKFHQKLESLKSRATELEIRINAELFGEARVIACTLVGSGHRLLDGRHFPTLFIDEAAQALEAACWIAIHRAGRVILAGDHCQLPPTVKSYEALKGGLGKTLMERIVEQKPEVVTLLRMQYRMNEEIMRFSSDWFYQNMVESHPSVKHRSILDLDLPMTWIDTSQYEGQEEFVGESFGRVNKTEAELTLLSLQAYFELIGKQRILDERIDVGIISPYRAQVQYLRRLIKKREFFKPFRTLISVNTVDGFQGQERDVIVISLVRSNDEGQIGFLRDLRRMNVAITRARMKLIILGDRYTLCRHPFYQKLWQYIQALNL